MRTYYKLLSDIFSSFSNACAIKISIQTTILIVLYYRKILDVITSTRHHDSIIWLKGNRKTSVNETIDRTCDNPCNAVTIEPLPRQDRSGCWGAERNLPVGLPIKP